MLRLIPGWTFGAPCCDGAGGWADAGNRDDERRLRKTGASTFAVHYAADEGFNVSCSDAGTAGAAPAAENTECRQQLVRRMALRLSQASRLRAVAVRAVAV
jgi:hypothetical protein